MIVPGEIYSVTTMRVLLMTIVLTVTSTFAVPKSPPKTTKGCPDLISPKRGTFRLSEDERSAEFFCQPGHTLLGHREVNCSKGVWSQQPPVCVGGDCEMPTIRDGMIISRYGGRLIRIECRTGFVLRDGTESIACIDGRWNSTKPQCINKKKELESEKSQRKTNNLIHRNPNFESREEQTSKKSHKEWLEESDYSCVRHEFTVYPPSVPNARPFTRWAMYDGLPRLYATYQCKWGFKPTAGGVRNVYCQNGRWIGSTPKCQAVVNEEPRQGDFSGLAVTLSHEKLLLHADYTCIGGSFDGTIDPPVLENTLNNVLRFVILEGRPHLYVEYSCEHGFELKNGKHAHLYCKEKRWIGEKPTCVPASKKSCFLNNGGCSQSCHEDSHRQIVCSCKDGYQLQTDAVSCTDIDECEVNGGDCDHLCDNTVGSYQCRCFPGYTLQPNNRSCSKNPQSSIQEDN